MIVKLLTEHHLELRTKLKRRLQRLVRVYIYQNATWLEITCYGSIMIEQVTCVLCESNSSYTLFLNVADVMCMV